MFGRISSFPIGLFDEIDRLRREMDDYSPWGRPASIRASAPGTFPAVNVGLSPEDVSVYAFLPGVDANALDVSIQENVLTIAGERKLPGTPRDERNGKHLAERFSGSFRRTIGLPAEVDADRVSARYTDGVLAVRIARREATGPRKIDIA